MESRANLEITDDAVSIQDPHSVFDADDSEIEGRNPRHRESPSSQESGNNQDEY